MGDLTHLSDVFGQSGLVARRRLFVNQTVAGGFVDQRGRGFESGRGFVAAGRGSNFFDRLAQFRAEGPVTRPLSFGRFHALGAGLMIRQDNTFPVFSNKLARKYNSHF